MLDLTSSFKGEYFKEFSKFQMFWESENNRLEYIPFDLVSTITHLYDRDIIFIHDKYVKEIIQEYPYLLFTNVQFLHNVEIIEYACSVDRYMLKALLLYGDDEVKEILSMNGFIIHLVQEYHCYVDQSMFPSDLEQYLEKSDIFKSHYYQDNVEYLLSTDEGNEVFKKYYLPFPHLHYQLMKKTPNETLKELLKTQFHILSDEAYIPLAHILDEDEYEFLTYSALIDLENKSYNDQENWLKPYILQMVDFSIKNRGKKTETLINSIDHYISSVTRPSFQFYIDCAKKEIPALVYSREFANDNTFWLETIRTNHKMIKYVPEDLLNDREFVLSARLFFDEILYYCSETLLESPIFILTYLTCFTSRVCFRVSKRLMCTENKNFLEAVAQLDPDAIHYFVHGDLLLESSN